MAPKILALAKHDTPYGRDETLQRAVAYPSRLFVILDLRDGPKTDTLSRAARTRFLLKQPRKTNSTNPTAASRTPFTSGWVLMKSKLAAMNAEGLNGIIALSQSTWRRQLRMPISTHALGVH